MPRSASSPPALYSTYLDNPMNKAYIAALEKKDPNIKREFVTRPSPMTAWR